MTTLIEENDELIVHQRQCFSASLLPAFKSAFDMHYLSHNVEDKKTYARCVELWKRVLPKTRHHCAQQAKIYNRKVTEDLKQRLLLSCDRIELSPKDAFIRKHFLKQCLDSDGNFKKVMHEFEIQFVIAKSRMESAAKVMSLMRNIKEKRLRSQIAPGELVDQFMKERIDEVVEQFSASFNNRMAITNYVLLNPGLLYSQLVVRWQQMDNTERLRWSGSTALAPERLWYMCGHAECGEAFWSKHELQKHVETHDEKRYYVGKPGELVHYKCSWQLTECQPCASVFRDWDQYLFHLNRFHIAMVIGKGGSKPLNIRKTNGTGA